LTTQKFYAIGSGSTVRVYRTGDLGRLGADDCLEHLGRVDGAVHIRGQTVAIADVEAALLAHPDIQDAPPPIALDRATIPRTYEAMAEQHLAAMRSVLPRGPYRLGGLCNGGLVAFEIARLLEADGELVDRLVLVAATAPRFELRWLDVSIE